MTTNKSTTTAEELAVIAAVEAGGTSFVVAICYTTTTASDLPTIVHRTQIDSSHSRPHQTLAECAAFLELHKPPKGYHALGIGSFGPLGTRVGSNEYGCILESSPKAAWRNVNLLKPLREVCQGSQRRLAIRVDTDVNAPAWAEYLRARRQEDQLESISSLAYITVGTGIGVGLVVNHQIVHGRMHPEGGHVPVTIRRRSNNQ